MKAIWRKYDADVKKYGQNVADYNAGYAAGARNVIDGMSKGT